MVETVQGYTKENLNDTNLTKTHCLTNEYAEELKAEIRSNGRAAFIERNEKNQPRVVVSETVVFSSPFRPAFE